MRLIERRRLFAGHREISLAIYSRLFRPTVVQSRDLSSATVLTELEQARRRILRMNADDETVRQGAERFESRR